MFAALLSVSAKCSNFSLSIDLMTETFAYNCQLAVTLFLAAKSMHDEDLLNFIISDDFF